MRSIFWRLRHWSWQTSGGSARPADDLDWTVYHNARFGLQMRYPADVFSRRRTSEARDGDLFSTSDGSAKLLIGAFENTEGLFAGVVPAVHRARILSRPARRLCACRADVDGAFGTRGNTMVYEKVMFSCGGQVINSFAIVYPIAERRLYDPIVEAIEDSFRPGVQGATSMPQILTSSGGRPGPSATIRPLVRSAGRPWSTVLRLPQRRHAARARSSSCRLSSHRPPLFPRSKRSARQQPRLASSPCGSSIRRLQPAPRVQAVARPAQYARSSADYQALRRELLSRD